MTLPPSERFDIIIGGGGFAGLALARALAASVGAGFRVAVIEQAPRRGSGSSRSDGRAVAISAASKKLLDAIGVWPRLAQDAQPIRHIDITDSGLDAAVRLPVLGYENVLDGDLAASFMVENAVLRAALEATIAGTPEVTVMQPHTIRAMTAGEASIEVRLDDGRALRAPLLIAADGRRSGLREMARIKSVSWSYPQIAITVIVGHELPHEARATQHFLPAGPFAILPLTGNRCCITWTEGAGAGRAIMALDDANFLAQVEQRFGHQLGRLALLSPRASWPLEMSLARTFRARRLALIGDAARSVHPIAGQGLNLAMRDVAALSEVVAEAARLGLDIGGGEVLERYERWRRFDGLVSAAAFDGLNRLFSNDSALLRAMRDVGLGLVDRLPGLKGLLIKEAAGLTGQVPRLLKGELA